VENYYKPRYRSSLKLAAVSQVQRAPFPGLVARPARRNPQVCIWLPRSWFPFLGVRSHPKIASFVHLSSHRNSRGIIYQPAYTWESMLVYELIIFKAEVLLPYFLHEIARERSSVEVRQRKFCRVKSSQTRYRRGLLTLDYRPFCTTDPVTREDRTWSGVAYVCTCYPFELPVRVRQKE